MLLVASLVVPLAGHAAEEADNSTDDNSPMPRCGPLMDGQVYCKFGVVYECELIDPNSLERRSGWRWKPDILRSCPRERPATIDPVPVLPPIITYVPIDTDHPCPRSAQNAARPEDRRNAEPSVGTMHVHPDGVGCR